MEDAIQSSTRRLRAKATRESHFLVNHSQEMASDVAQVWTNLQQQRLHHCPAVVAANLRAARVVSQLTIAVALMPNLADASFVEEYERLRRHPKGAPYFEHYVRAVGDRALRLDPALTSFLYMERLIGQGPGPSEMELMDLILAKDYVASLSDQQASKLHAHLLAD